MNTLQKYDSQVPMLDMGISQLGQVFYESKLFPNVTSAAQAQVKIMAGAENGFGPFTSMSGIHLIPGKGGTRVELGADMHATAVKRSARYDYQVKESTRQQCVIEFWSISKRTGRWEVLGISTYTLDDAKQAGLTGRDNWKNYPDMMLFARAMTNGVARFCPDVFESRIYHEGELTGDAIETETDEKDIPPDPLSYDDTLIHDLHMVLRQGIERGAWTGARLDEVDGWLESGQMSNGKSVSDKTITAMITKLNKELTAAQPQIAQPDEATLALWLDELIDAEGDGDAFRAARDQEDWNECQRLYLEATGGTV